ncbi:MAG: hypothetical protein H7A23_08020 [Leptospiraceae bacterium]|nr:hypothetical protein [Leptospiraceae bacterium]
MIITEEFKSEIIEAIYKDAGFGIKLFEALISANGGKTISPTYLDEALAKQSKEFDEKLFRLGEKLSKEFDEKLFRLGEKLSKEFDEKLAKLSKEFDEKLVKLSKEFDEKLAKLSKEFDEKLVKLSKEFDEKLVKLSKEFDEKLKPIKKQLGGLSMVVGYGLEDKIIPLMKGFVRDNYKLYANKVERTEIVYANGNYDEVNILVEGVNSTGDIEYVIGECKAQPSKKDIDRFAKMLGRLKMHFQKKVYSFMVGYSYNHEVLQYIYQQYPEISIYKSYEFDEKYSKDFLNTVNNQK